MKMTNLNYDPAKLVGWKPKRWDFANKNATSTYKSRGRKKRGKHCKSPASIRRKARSLARRKA